MRKKIKRITAVLLTLVVVCSCLFVYSTITSSAERITNDEFTIQTNSKNEAKILKYHGNQTTVNIPENINGYDVVELSGNIFENRTDVEEIIVPDTVKKIDSFAFAYCDSLIKITIPGSVNIIDSQAFITNTSNSYIRIETYDELEMYGYTNSYSEKFAYENKMKFVSIGTVSPFVYDINKDQTITIKTYNGINDTIIDIPSSIDGRTVTIIGESAFGDLKKLEKVNIPDTVVSISARAFYRSGLVSIKLSKNLKTIGEGAFYNTKLEKIVIPNSVERIESKYSNYSYVSTFGSCENLKSIILSEKLKTIESATFDGCKALEEIVIPNSVTVIKDRAFIDCLNLRKVIIPNSVQSIEVSAFLNCRNLTEVSIPKSVNTIGNSALGYYVINSLLKIKGFTIYGYSGTTAETYANNNGFTFVELDESTIGDTNGDNTVDVLDAASVQKHATGKADLTDEQLAAADVNGDGNVDVLDAADIQKFAAGIITEFKKKA